jgi:uncharacterized membrane protein YeaQ/YmgE (transglycosylase-associated protein family)
MQMIQPNATFLDQLQDGRVLTLQLFQLVHGQLFLSPVVEVGGYFLVSLFAFESPFFEIGDGLAARYPALVASASVMNLPRFVLPKNSPSLCQTPLPKFTQTSPFAFASAISCAEGRGVVSVFVGACLADFVAGTAVCAVNAHGTSNMAFNKTGPTKSLTALFILGVSPAERNTDDAISSNLRQTVNHGGFSMFHLIGTIIFGLIVGIVAKLLTPGRDPGGFFITAIIGIIGSLIGGFIGRALGLYNEGDSAGFIMSVIGAMVLLFFYHLATRRTTA